MIIQPAEDGMFMILPETEVEQYYVQNFMKLWRQGTAKIVITNGIIGQSPTSTMEISPTNPPAITLLPFLKKPL